jgi:hypothetical protein
MELVMVLAGLPAIAMALVRKEVADAKIRCKIKRTALRCCPLIINN